MKRSKTITLLLITAALASCHKKKVEELKNQPPNVYMRGDATADYSAVTTQYQGSGNFWLWYYAFRPYGTYYGGTYHHAGYYSGAISQSSNVGTSFSKSAIITGGFGHGTVSVSS